MTNKYKDIHGVSLRAGDYIKLLDVPPPISKGIPRHTEGYLAERVDGGFVMMYYDEVRNAFVSNRVNWYPPEKNVPHPRCKIIKKAKPAFVINVKEGTFTNCRRTNTLTAALLELNGIKPLINVGIKVFLLF